MHYVGGRTGAQLLQVLHRQKELMVALPFYDLKKPVDAVQPRLLHPIDQPASPALTYKSSRIWVCQYTNDLGKCETYQNVIQQNRGKPGNKRDRFRSKGSLGDPRVSYHGPLTRTTPFASFLGESGSPVTNCSRGLWADWIGGPQSPTSKYR